MYKKLNVTNVIVNRLAPPTFLQKRMHVREGEEFAVLFERCRILLSPNQTSEERRNLSGQWLLN
jgi:hypothetical protein